MSVYVMGANNLHHGSNLKVSWGGPERRGPTWSKAFERPDIWDQASPFLGRWRKNDILVPGPFKWSSSWHARDWGPVFLSHLNSLYLEGGRGGMYHRQLLEILNLGLLEIERE